MKLYADGPVRRTLQMLGDLLLVLWVALWLKLAYVVHDATLALAAPGQKIEAAGGGLAGKLRDAGIGRRGPPARRRPGPVALRRRGQGGDQIADAGPRRSRPCSTSRSGWAHGRRAADPAGRARLPAPEVAVRPRGERRPAVHRLRRRPRPVRAASDVPPAAAPDRPDQPGPGAGLAGGDADVVRALAVLELADTGLAPTRQDGGMTVPNVVLNNGIEIPQLGFGVWRVPNAETQPRSRQRWTPATGTSTPRSSTTTRRASAPRCATPGSTATRSS